MQAVILCHQESFELRQLTCSGVVGQLPLSNGVVLSNLLKVFETVGIFDSFIVCRPEQATIFKESLLTPSFEIDCSKLTFVEVSAKFSVPECLYKLRDQITAQYVYLTYGDLVVTDLNIRRLFLSMIRTKASMVSVASTYSKDPKVVKSMPCDFLVIDEHLEQLAMFIPASESKKQKKISKQVIAAHHHLVTYSHMIDAGFYLLSSYALKLLEWIRDESGVKRNFFKHLVNVEQYKSNQLEAFSSQKELPTELQLREPAMPRSFSISVVVHQDKAICRRLDSPGNYLSVVKTLREQYSSTSKEADTVVKESTPGSNRNPVADCLIGQECTFGMNILVRSCILGEKCGIANDSRVISSVLLRNINIKENCKVTNCLIGDGVVIGENCVLKDCAIAARQSVPPRTQIQNENLGFSEIDLDLV